VLRSAALLRIILVPHFVALCSLANIAKRESASAASLFRRYVRKRTERLAAIVDSRHTMPAKTPGALHGHSRSP